MPPRSARTSSEEPPREQSHADIIGRIDRWGLELKQAHAELKGEMRGRFDGVDREIQGIRATLTGITGRVAVLEGDSAQHEQALVQVSPAHGGATAEHDGGLPFKHGWRSWAAIAAIGIGILGGLATAVEKAGNVLINFAHMFNAPPPAH